MADQWTYTPLHAAASYGQVDVLRYLLNHPSAARNAIETTDDDGDTPLFAVEDVRIARILVEEFGADAKHENNAGDTAAANAEENELAEVAAYLRSVTGEAPMYQRLQGLTVDGDDDDDDEGREERRAGMADTSAMDAAIEEQTEALMVRVQEILRRAELRGASSGEELNEAEEEELRRVVGESLFSQIREGWGAAVSGQIPFEHATQQTRQPEESRSQTETGSVTDSSDADRPSEDDEAEPQPGR